MGGSRSGRYGWRGVIEGRTRLDIRHLRRQGWLVPGGVVSLSFVTHRSTIVRHDANVVAALLLLAARVAETSEANPEKCQSRGFRYSG